MEEEKKNYLSKEALKKGLEIYKSDIEISTIRFIVDNSLDMDYLKENCAVYDVSVDQDKSILMYLTLGFEVVDSKRCFEVNIYSKDKIYFEENMSYAFAKLPCLLHVDGLENVDASDVINMEGMFEDCPRLTHLDLSSFNSPKVTNTGYMFNNCRNLEYIDLSNLNVTNLKKMTYMFNNTGTTRCHNYILEGLYLQNQLEVIAVMMMKDIPKIDMDNLNTIIKATGLSIERLLELADGNCSIRTYIDIVKLTDNIDEEQMKRTKERKM